MDIVSLPLSWSYGDGMNVININLIEQFHAGSPSKRPGQA